MEVESELPEPYQCVMNSNKYDIEIVKLTHQLNLKNNLKYHQIIEFIEDNKNNLMFQIKKDQAKQNGHGMNQSLIKMEGTDKKITISIYKQQYEFSLNSDLVKSNKLLNEVFENYDKVKDLVLKKSQKKHHEIEKLAEHQQFTALEYLIWSVKDHEHKLANKHKIGHPEECSICMCELYDINNFQMNDLTNQLEVHNTEDDVFKLSKCSDHFFHINCFLNYLKINKMESYTQCPVCRQVYGIMTGKQPPGTMKVSYDNRMHCSGYQGCGTIIVQYYFPSGQHKDVNNGVRYSGTGRTGFLPNNKEGQDILKLLQISFDRKLTFMVGTSVTTGEQNTVVWAGVHHKTSMHGGPFGYPDPTYLSRVREELAARGVF